MNQHADRVADFAIQNEPRGTVSRFLKEEIFDDCNTAEEITEAGIDIGLEFDAIGELLADKFDKIELGTELAEALDSIWGLRAQIRILEQKLKSPLTRAGVEQ